MLRFAFEEKGEGRRGGTNPFRAESATYAYPPRPLCRFGLLLLASIPSFVLARPPASRGHVLLLLCPAGSSVVRGAATERNGGVGRAYMSVATAVDPAWIPALAKAPPRPKPAAAAGGGGFGASGGGGGGSEEGRAPLHPLLRLSAPLSSPLPTFDAAKDCVVAFVVPKVGMLCALRSCQMLVQRARGGFPISFIYPKQSSFLGSFI